MIDPACWKWLGGAHRCMIGLAAANAFEGERMGIDRFGNPHASNLSYARGEILRSTEDDFQKLQRAWSLIRQRGPGSTYVFTGLEHSLPLAAEELELADDEIAPALSFERLKELALDHLGGSPETDDVAVFNRLTGAT